MAEPSQRYGLLLGLAVFLHLLVVPDYLVYTNVAAADIAAAALFPFQQIYGSLYFKDVVYSNFTYLGSFTCTSAASCLGTICANATDPSTVNNICLQPVVARGGCNATGPPPLFSNYTWLFGICMTLVALELLALAAWFAVYRTRFAAQFTALFMGAPQSARYAAIVTWVMHAVTVCTSLVLLTATQTSTLAQVVVAVLVRLIGVGFVVAATLLDLQQQQLAQLQQDDDDVGGGGGGGILYTAASTGDKDLR